MHGHSWLFPGGLMTVVVWSIPVIIAVAILFLIFSGGKKSGSGDKTPIQLLEESYARGEIGREEFMQKHTDLQSEKASSNS
jgi:putative membrane protein